MDFAVILMVSEYFVVVYFLFEYRESTLGEKVLIFINKKCRINLFSKTN